MSVHVFRQHKDTQDGMKAVAIISEVASSFLIGG